MRDGEPSFDLCERLPGAGKVVYLSLDPGVHGRDPQQRLIDALATTAHRTVGQWVRSKDRMQLGPHMYGDSFRRSPRCCRSATC